MEALNIETRNIQNPALGAMLLWRFAVGYEKGSKIKALVPIPLLYIVLPITLHEETMSFIESTRQSSGLRSFASKFAKSSTAKNDLILSIHERALKMKKLSTESLRLSITAKLMSIDPKQAVALPLTSTPARAGLRNSIKTMLQQAEKLGFWCSEVTMHEISLILKVGF